MKIPDHIETKIKEATASVRLFGGQPTEIYWTENDEPWDQTLHGNWGGHMASLSDLRAWIRQHGADGRRVTFYRTNEETSECAEILLT